MMRWAIIFIILIGVVMVASPAGVTYLEEKEKNVPQPLKTAAHFSQAARGHLATMGHALIPEQVQVFITDVLGIDKSTQTQHFTWQQVGETGCAVSLGMQLCQGKVRGQPCSEGQEKRKCGTQPKACDTRAADGSIKYNYTVFSCLPASAY